MAFPPHSILYVRLKTAGVIFLVVALVGCAFHKDAPTSQFKKSLLITENGQRVDSIGIVPAQYSPELRLQTPAREWLFRAERGALAEGKDTFKKGMQYFALVPCSGGRGCGVVALISLVWFSAVATGSTVAAGVSAVQGGIEGAMTAPDTVTMGKAEEIARSALGDLHTQESMAGALELLMREWLQGSVAVPKIQKLMTAGPTSPTEDRQYDALTKEGIDIVLETTVQTLKYKEYENDASVNPLLRLSMTVSAKFVRVRDGNTLHSSRYEYESYPYTFEVWASDDGAYLLNELDRGYKDIARQIASNLF